MKELHLTKKDFKLEWFSGQGAGGQHRNKHQNCCRITHLETGLRAQATESRQRKVNQEVAFTRLAEKLITHYYPCIPKNRFNSTEVIRTYHEGRNIVIDVASGCTETYKKVVLGGDLSSMINGRRVSMLQQLPDE